MRQIVNYINEKLHITSKQQYSCQPKTKKELQEIIIQRIEDEGPECDLNDIDVSKITDMSFLFNGENGYDLYNKIFNGFNGDISQWNVSNVKDMYKMFLQCTQFDCDLSKWDVSNVKDMRHMFEGCIKFNGNLSNWDVSNVTTMMSMFYGCTKFNCNLSRWNVSNVRNIDLMFDGCENFRQNLDQWDVSNVTHMRYVFFNCPTTPKWYDKNTCES